VSRARHEGGFTLPELLTTLFIALVVALAAFALVETVMRRSQDVQQRVDANQRGRMAMEQITRQLRSQVCLDANTAPVVEATQNRVVFYGRLDDGAAELPERRTLTFDPTQKSIVERVDRGVRAMPVGATAPVYTWTQKSQRTVLRNVIRDTDGGAAQPVFTYWRYVAGTVPPQLQQLTTVSATDLPYLAKIGLRFDVLPSTATQATKASAPLFDEVVVRLTNPETVKTTADPAPRATCI
jgi:prepilin-type N-terminal cleavage/methylation domain-containing protein